MRKVVTKSDAFCYSMGSFGTGVFSTVPAVLLLFFCTETLRISGAVAAVLILIPKLWSIVWDPFVGSWSDRSMHSWGRRRPFMVTGIVGMVAAFVMLFNVPLLPIPQTIAWIGVSYFALATLYSLFAVPYIAIPAEVCANQASLSRLVSWRMVLVMLGILVGAAGAPLFVAANGGGRAGYGAMGWAIGTLCLLAMSLPLLMLRGRDRRATQAGQDRPPTSLARDMLAALANLNFQRLSFAYLAQSIAFGAFSGILPYVVSKALGRTEADIGTALGIYLASTIIAIPVWSWLATKLTLRGALKLASIGFGLGTSCLGLIILFNLEWNAALTLLAMTGAPFAGLQVLPFTLVGEIIRAEGASAEGRFTGIWTATEKLGLALGAVLVGHTIDIAQGNLPIGIGLFVCAVPLSLCFMSLLFLTHTKESE